ncbi:MAG: TetR/AcrR family transcriptional regulator [Comamonas sp.]|nr:TetR/AcrR family transcriptional regulator [Comamonas sp.]
MSAAVPTSCTSNPKVPRRSRRKEARPAELLAAATRLFVEKGYAATRVEEVAALANVSKGTLFLYYASKEALLKAVVRENIAGSFAEWQAEVDNFTGTSAALVRYAFQVWQARIGDTEAGGIYKLLSSEFCNFPELAQFYFDEVIYPGNDLVRRILARGMARGEFRQLDLNAAIHLITTPMFTYIQWRNSIGMTFPDSLGISPEVYIETQVENLLRGLAALPPTTVSV